MNLKQTAKQIAKIYKENQKVEAILLAGSVANGWEDDFSDIELHIYWNTAPTDTDRQSPIQSIYGTVLSFYPLEDDEWSESFLTEGGIKLEISNFLTSTVDNIIDDVCHAFDTNYDKQCILASLHDGIPLYGNERIEDLKRRILFYPEKLSQAMMKENLFLGNRWNNRRALIKRQDLFMLHGVKQEVLLKLMGALFGLNRLYVHHPSFKWLANKIQGMTITPSDLENKVTSILISDSVVAFDLLEKLVQETVLLIEHHYPDLDIEEQKMNMLFLK